MMSTRNVASYPYLQCHALYKTTQELPPSFEPSFLLRVFSFNLKAAVLINPSRENNPPNSPITPYYTHSTSSPIHSSSSTPHHLSQLTSPTSSSHLPQHLPTQPSQRD